MKIPLAILVLAAVSDALPLSLRFIFMPKSLVHNSGEDVSPIQQQQQEPDMMQSRSDLMQSPLFDPFNEPLMEQSGPMAFTAQARMAVAPGPFIPMGSAPEPEIQSTMQMQRRMDADPELLEQMPYSPQRRMDEEESQGQGPPQGLPQGSQHQMFPQGMPLVHVSNQPIPFLIQVPLAQGRDDQERPQPQMGPEMQQMPLSLPLVMPPQGPQPIEFRQFPMTNPMMSAKPEIMSSSSSFDDDDDSEPEVEEAQERKEVSDYVDDEPPINVQQQRFLVIQSAAKLRPVIVDSLETVMKFFNAVAPEVPPPTTPPTPAPEANNSASVQVDKLARKLDHSLETLTLQVADALGTLTAHAKQLLPMLLKSNVNATNGIVEPGNDTLSARSIENEVKEEMTTEIPFNAQNLTETISRYVQLNSDEFRRTWKHFLHHYWTYVQKILENVQ